MSKHLLLYFALLFWWVVPVGAQLTLSLPELIVDEGDEIEVDMTVENFSDIITVQFTAKWDPTVLEFMELVDTNLVSRTSLSINLNETASGLFRFWWLEPLLIGESLDDGDYLLKMRFKVIGTKGTSSPLEISDDPTPYLAGDANSTDPIATARNNGMVSVGIIDGIEELASGKFRLYPNQPNPFREKTTIQFDLTDSEYITFSLFDLSGKKILEQHQSYSAGSHYITLEQHQLPASGTYLYQIQAGQYLLTEKLTLVR